MLIKVTMGIDGVPYRATVDVERRVIVGPVETARVVGWQSFWTVAGRVDSGLRGLIVKAACEEG